MKNKKFVFLILHYLTIDDTVNCINSIKDNCRENKVDIVIVDNGSKNNTGFLLKTKYFNDPSIHVIINEKNLGFANGNNIGFKYAKEKLNADFIIMVNNDTYLIQNNFCKLIFDEYKKSEFAVLGPKILLKNNEVNKVMLNIQTVNQLKKQLKNSRIEYITNLFFMNDIYIKTKNMIKSMLVKLKLKKRPKKELDNDVNKRYENIVLHGCCLIFSKRYINLFDGLDERTFLFREEELLTLRLKKYNLKSVYNPNIVIFHNEDSSTNEVSKTKRKKQMLISINQIKSTKILLKELEIEGVK